MILRCQCRHKGQDKLHGRSLRAHNPMKCKPGQTQMWRCTVCVNERDGPDNVHSGSEIAAIRRGSA